MLMRTFNGMLESYPLFMSVGFVRHHSPFAISYIWFTTTPGYWLSDTASPAVKSQMFNFTLFWYGDWNARSDWSVQTKYFHAFLSPWKAEHFWYLHSVQSASFEVPNCVSFLFFYYFPLFGQRNLFSTSFSPIMKELPNYNYENFARRNFTFMKIYSLNLIYIYIYMCKYLGSSPVRWRISDVFPFIRLCATSKMTYFPFSATHKFSGWLQTEHEYFAKIAITMLL